MAFTTGTAKDVSDAQSKKQAGKDIMGKTSDKQKDGDANDPPKKLGPVIENNDVGATVDTVPFSNDSIHMTFEELPPVLLPDKAAFTIDDVH